MSQLTDRLERDLREIAAGAHPSPSAWESIVARLDDDAEPEVAVMLAPGPDRSKRPLWIAVAAAVLVVVLGSIAVLTRDGDDHSISTADFPNLTTTFVSPRNGFSIRHPEGAAVTPAIEDGFDVVDTGLAAVFKGTSSEFLDEPVIDERNRTVGPDEQIDDYLSDDGLFPGGCGVPRRRQASISIDGQPGRVAECPDHIEATVVVGGKLYVFTLSHDRSDARAVFDAFVATIELTPETAVHFPALTETFVSPTYGYSFRYIRQLTPATERWDPGNQPLDNIDFDPRFDAVQTGFGAYFEGASTPIPDGVSIDGWVDEYVTPLAAGGCGVPRSRQAEITIDGQSGRIAECDHVEATVVAGGRLYLFTLGHSRSDARAFFDAWIATIDLRPETAAVP
jgi:hypothetical protein